MTSGRYRIARFSPFFPCNPSSSDLATPFSLWLVHSSFSVTCRIRTGDWGSSFPIGAQSTLYPEGYLHCQAHLPPCRPGALLSLCSHPQLCSPCTAPFSRPVLGCRSGKAAVHILTLTQVWAALLAGGPQVPLHTVFNLLKRTLLGVEIFWK